jgi:3-methylfumaryl-CoA hydratase
MVHPLRCGIEATRTSYVLSTTEKEGRTGALTFVTVRNEIRQDGRVAIIDEQDIVYRDAVTGGSHPFESVSRADVAVAEGDRRGPIDPVLLFRFSALTYNAHRIHYDREYATRVEGYAGLVVHGPLQVLLMAEALRASAAQPPTAFEYRLESPLLDHQGLIIKSDDGSAWIEDSAGRRTASGHA